MIGIVDYGLGNIEAIATIYKRLNIPAQPVATGADILNAERIILPGVGAFDRAIRRLNESGLREGLTDAVLVKRKPILGICVGMQMFAETSDEGSLPGLAWVGGHVRKFDLANEMKVRLPLPHMGWNDVTPREHDGLFRKLEREARFYFLHSYYFCPHNEQDVLAVTDYNGRYASSVNSGNIFGVQFHPEKSHQWGVQLLKNFAEL